MNLVCKVGENPNYQCTAVENGVRCDRGVKNVYRGLCAKHLARLLRHGTTDSNSKGESKKERAERADKRREERAARGALAIANMRKKNGWSDTCFCTHIFDSHGPVTGSCQEPGCKCSEYDCSNPGKIAEFFAKAAKLGFSKALNDTAYCNRCSKFIRVGHWHNPETIGRMRLHLREHMAGSRFRRVG